MRRRGIDVPLLGQITAAEDTDEVVLTHDGALLAAGTAPEHHLVGEVGWVLKLDSVQRAGDGRPGDDVRAVSGRLVADVVHHPAVRLAGETDFSGAQDVLSVGACHVFAPSGGQPERAVHADHEGERFGQVHRRPFSGPGAEVGRRADPAAAARPDRAVRRKGRSDQEAYDPVDLASLRKWNWYCVLSLTFVAITFQLPAFASL